MIYLGTSTDSIQKTSFDKKESSTSSTKAIVTIVAAILLGGAIGGTTFAFTHSVIPSTLAGGGTFFLGCAVGGTFFYCCYHPSKATKEPEKLIRVYPIRQPTFASLQDVDFECICGYAIFASHLRLSDYKLFDPYLEKEMDRVEFLQRTLFYSKLDETYPDQGVTRKGLLVWYFAGEMEEMVIAAKTAKDGEYDKNHLIFSEDMKKLTVEELEAKTKEFGEYDPTNVVLPYLKYLDLETLNDITNKATTSGIPQDFHFWRFFHGLQQE